jgi:aspartate racemase
MDSLDFAVVEDMQHQDKWTELCELMKERALNLQEAGAEIILLCTNTMHLCADRITEGLSVPFLHIADAAAEAIQSMGLERVGLMGTRFTMEKEFYSGPLRDRFGIEVITPDENDRERIHDCIYNELVRGIFSEDSRNDFKEIITELESRGAQGVILGCTEIPLLIRQEDVDIPVFDTTALHVEAALELALGTGRNAGGN